LERVQASLHVLDETDLVKPELALEQTWGFKHGVTQEVVYESIPFGFRAMLHARAGAYVETAEADDIERHLDLLAYHYGHSDDLPKKREYLRRAGDAAEGAYANAAAIDYYERLAPLLTDGDRVDVLLKLAKVLELVGSWHRAEEVSGEALLISQRLRDERACGACETALAEVARKQGRYDEAYERLDRARASFQGVEDEAGVGRVLHLVGTVAAQRGDYQKAVENYEASLAIRERRGDAASMAGLLSNLGIVAEYRGDYKAARAFHEKALALRKSLGDRRNISVSLNNLGMIATLEKRFAEARERFAEGMHLFAEVGDTWAVAIGHNNLGNALRGLGDFDGARSHYASSLRAYRDYDDRWALAFLLEDIGLLAALSADPRRALEFIGVADHCRTLIGAPRPPSLESDIEAQLVASAANMPPDGRDACRARGRSCDLSTAVARALDYCEGNALDELQAMPAESV
ncbi:MAG TPA: tetratricopeptide repeat protein, partial [Casimicrobiaceae bacterium]|nr:tetratricopeptide repeat protein [Casimicrobiaceae bacterium]